eukprot:259052-Pyramimonas_sp.AAC.1
MALSRGVLLLTAMGLAADVIFKPLAMPIDKMLSAVAEDVGHWPPVDRTLDLALVCGGEAGIKFVAEMRGLKAASFELLDNPCMNFLSLGGLIIMVDMTRRVKRRGTLWISPECRTWLSYLSRATYQRDAVNGILGEARHAANQQTLSDANATVM